MSLEYIRKTYKVPAHRGGRIAFTPMRGEPEQIGKITGSKGSYLRVMFESSKFSKLLHPTWEVRYLEDEDGLDG